MVTHAYGKRRRSQLRFHEMDTKLETFFLFIRIIFWYRELLDEHFNKILNWKVYRVISTYQQIP